MKEADVPLDFSFVLELAQPPSLEEELHLEKDRQRVLNMERWYILDGRHRYDHPQHGLYTGLAAKGADLDSFDGIV